MAADRRLVAAAALGLVGGSIAVYLTAVHYAGVPVACGTGGVVDCDLVTQSAFGTVPGTSVPVSALGIAWAAVTVALAGAALAWRHRLAPVAALAAWALAGTLAVIYLVRAEAVLGHLCEWCTAFHLCVVATLLLAASTLQSRAADPHR